MLDFTLKQLEVFMAAAEYASFTRAAEALYLTQSTVSAHIQGLERALGAPLFLRSAHRRVTLTEVGKQTYTAAQDILSRCTRLRSAPADSPAPMLALGASTVPAQYLLPQLLAGFSKQRPDCRFLLKRGDSVQVHRMLRSGEVQAGFVGMVLDEWEYEYLPVLEDKLVLVTENAPRFQTLRADGGLALLLAEPVVAREENSGTWRTVENWLRQREVPPERLHILARMENPEAIRQAVARGMGVSVLSSLAAEEDVAAGRLLSFDLDREGVWRRLYLAVSRDSQEDEVRRGFVEFVLRERGGYHR